MTETSTSQLLISLFSRWVAEEGDGDSSLNEGLFAIRLVRERP